MDMFKKPEPSPGKTGCRKGMELLYKLTLDALNKINEGKGGKLQDIVCYMKKNYKLKLDDQQIENGVKNGVERGLFEKVVCRTVHGIYKLKDSIKLKPPPEPSEPVCICPRPPPKSEKKSKCPNPKSKPKSSSEKSSSEGSSKSSEEECPPPEESSSSDEESSGCSDEDDD